MSDRDNGPPMHLVGLVVLELMIAASVIFAVSLFVFGQPGRCDYFYPPFNGMMMNYWPVGLFFGVLWISAIFWVIRLVFSQSRWGFYGRYSLRHSYSYEVLRERYAKGEITKEQFEQMTRSLQQHPA
jgi:uncharacterized membrane protein